MAAPVYATDLTTINDGSGTFTEPAGALLGTLSNVDTDNFIQSTSCSSKSTGASGAPALAGIGIQAGAAQTIASPNAYYAWVFVGGGGLVDTLANGGIRLIIGQDINNYRYWYVDGSDFFPYIGWQCIAIETDNAVVAATGSQGTPTATKQYFGAVFNCKINIGKGNPMALDAIRWGRTITVTAGDAGSGYATFSGIAAYNDSINNRFGQFAAIPGGYQLQGKLLLGQTAGTAVDFRDSNANIVIAVSRKTATSFNAIEIQKTTSRVDWDACNFSALGTNSRGTITVTDDCAVNITGCSFTGMDTFGFLATTVATDSTWRGCNAVTAAGSDMRRSKILVPTVAADASALVWNVATDPDGKLDNMTFSKGTNAHHAITLGASSPTTVTLRGITFTGFNATDAQNDSVILLADQGSNKSWIINTVACSGTVSIKKTRAGDSFTVVRYVTVQVTVKDESGNTVDGARVAVYKTSDMTEIMNTTTSGGVVTKTDYSYVSDTAVTIRVRKSSAATKYIATETSGTISSTGLATTVTFVAELIAEATTDANINGDFTVNTTTKTIRHVLGETPIYTVKKFYTWLMDYFDESGLMDDTIPMTAQTPSEYTLVNGWFIDDISTQFLKEGAIQTSGWTHPTNITGIRILTLASITGVDATDLGTAVAGVTTGDTGKLVDYNTALKKLWVRTDAADDDFNNTSENINVNGSLAGAMGGAVAVTGETIWSNIFTLGTLVSGTTMDLYQNDTQITPFWSSGHIDILVKVKEASVETDSGNLTVLARKYSTLYDHFVIDASTGRNPVPLAAFTDTNNATAEGTVGAAPYTNIAISTFGAKSQDLSNGNGLSPYEVEINCATLTLAQVYEYLKYVTRTGSGSTLNGVNGEYYTAVGDIRFTYTAGVGTFAEGDFVTDATSGATGYITSRIAGSNTLVLRNTHGTFSNTDNISSGAKTGTINSVPDPIIQSKQAPFGTFAGGNFFGARGVWIYNMASADATKYSLKDSTNTTQNPPNVVPISITVKDEAGAVVENARVAVYKTSDMTVLNNELTNASGIAETIFTYPGSDVPVIIRVRKSSATPKYVSVETAGSISSTGLTATVTFVAESIAESTTDPDIGGDFTVSTTLKTIRHVSGETPVYTVKKFYTWLMDYFDDSGLMDDTIPMTAQTPSEYTLVNGWFIDDTSTQFLKEGAIQTSGWTHPTNTTGVRILTLDAAANLTSADIGTVVLGGTTTDTGKLLHYDTTLKKLWVRADATDDNFDDVDEAITVDAQACGNMTAAAVTGETIYSNIFTLGTLVSGTTTDLYQNDTQITPFWSSGHIDILVKVKEASVETDIGNLTVLARKYGTLYDHYVVDASTGRNPIPLAAFTDGNNATASGTVSGYSDITITFGTTSQDIGNGAKPYDVIIDCVNNRTVAQAYEYLKYVTRHDSATTLNGASGEFYEAVGDIRFTYTTGSGTISQGSAITDSTSGATGYITSRIASSNTLVVTRTHGTFSNTDSISSGGATGTINSVPDSISPSKQAPFGTFAGGRFFGARGVFIKNMLDPNNYQLIDSTDTADAPPVSATATITVKDSATPPVAIENARVLVLADAGGPMPVDVTVTISNSGTTATVTHASHGLATNDKVTISGASLIQNLGVFTITLDGGDPTNKYTYTMTSAPGSSPTGTIKSTFVVLEGLTNASGIITMSRVFPSNQPVVGWARKTSAPYYKEGSISGTVNSSTGFSASLLLVSDA